jgi:hypothetical protein
MSERRNLERYDLTVPARVTVYKAHESKEVFETNTCNISSKGAFIKTEHIVPEGTKVQLDVILPVNKVKELVGASTYVKITGKVIRVCIEGIAVTFDNKYELMPYLNY